MEELEKSTEEPMEELEKSTESTQLKLGAQNGEVMEVEDICDRCQGEVHVFCKQCNNSYCSTCSIQRHRIGKRKEHFIARFSKLFTNVVHVPLEDDGLSQPQGKIVTYFLFKHVCCTAYTLLNTRIDNTIMLHLFRYPGCQADWIAHEVLQKIILQRLATENNLCNARDEEYARGDANWSREEPLLPIPSSCDGKTDRCSYADH